jgi:hypothetical protein
MCGRGYSKKIIDCVGNHRYGNNSCGQEKGIFDGIEDLDSDRLYDGGFRDKRMQRRHASMYSLRFSLRTWLSR